MEAKNIEFERAAKALALATSAMLSLGESKPIGDQIQIPLEAAAEYPPIDLNNRYERGEDVERLQARKVKSVRMRILARKTAEMCCETYLLSVLKCEECGGQSLSTPEPYDVWKWECRACARIQTGQKQAEATAQIISAEAAQSYVEPADPRDGSLKESDLDEGKRKVKIFDMAEILLQIKTLDVSDSDTKTRLTATLKRLKEAGQLRVFEEPSQYWPVFLKCFAETHPNFEELIDANIRPSLAIAHAGGLLRPAPALLLGAPGVGKSFFAECIAQHLSVPNLKVDLATATNGSSLAGSSAFWSNSSPGELFRLMAFGGPGKRPVANPVVFLDELDKVRGDERYDPLGALYSLLEIESSKKFEDQSIPGIHFDCSHIRWLLACNTTNSIPAPILSRVHVFEIPELTQSQKRNMFINIFRSVVQGIGINELKTEIPESLVKKMDHLGMREFKTLVGVAIGRALEDGRWQVEANDFRRPGFEVVRTPMGFR